MSSPYTVQLPVFNGPLDLLLQLIEREELDITKVALAQVTDQFLAYIKVLEHVQLADIADFLVVAARLVLIKSEALLPRPIERAPGEEDPGEELARQLLAYKKYKQIASSLHEREAQNLRTYLRLAPPPKVEKTLDLSGVTALDLLEAVRRALALVPEKPSLGTVVAPPKVTIRDQIRLIARSLSERGGRVIFQRLLENAHSRMEIVVTFLATLELIKRRKIEARQSALFGEIELLSLGEWTEDESVLTELEFE
ncbi:MAG: segregation/condensation protein A [Anaerolineales bacterium]|nr:segregation/condensation protein A [Anaerolineales bacterium]